MPSVQLARLSSQEADKRDRPPQGSGSPKDLDRLAVALEGRVGRARDYFLQAPSAMFFTLAHSGMNCASDSTPFPGLPGGLPRYTAFTPPTSLGSSLAVRSATPPRHVNDFCVFTTVRS